MLHTKFRGNRPTGSGVEDFEGFLPYMSLVAILAMLPASYQQISFPYTFKLRYKI